MVPNHSPWIHQLNRTRATAPLSGDGSADVVIVGGGIAGIVSAYWILKNTDKSVLLLEADKVAHGATGHNAGQITSYFERSFADLVDEFGLELASDGQGAVESAWMLLDEIVADAKLTTPAYRFTGYAGLSTFEKVVSFLESNRLRVAGGLTAEELFIATEWDQLSEIPEQYAELYSVLPHQDLLGLLQTGTTSYIAAVAYQKGCMNSALFSEELAGYLLATHGDCFKLHEESPVTNVTLEEGKCVISGSGFTAVSQKVLLCTNGFEHFTITNTVGEEIDTSFHHMVNGRIGYMAGYVEPLNSPPAAISYFPPSTATDDPTGEPYFYLTRRPHEHEGQTSFNLVCAGGPDSVLPNLAIYSRQDPCRTDMRDVLDEFLRDTYRHYPTDIEYAFCWHGLMGYTPNGVRRVGFEPKNKDLLYNLGCNGVGILPSIYGGKRIAQLLAGENLAQSIFDPEA